MLKVDLGDRDRKLVQGEQIFLPSSVRANSRVPILVSGKIICCRRVLFLQITGVFCRRIFIFANVSVNGLHDSYGNEFSI